MELPPLIRAPIVSQNEVSASLDRRLRQIRNRRRRAAIRQLATAACWAAGLLGAVAFALAVSIQAAPK
jgi:hypothetical protein